MQGRSFYYTLAYTLSVGGFGVARIATEPPEFPRFGRLVAVGLRAVLLGADVSRANANLPSALLLLPLQIPLLLLQMFDPGTTCLRS